MWVHFETFHEEFQPTYMSMYHPAQGLVLAAGKTLFQHPWFGVCLSVGAMCAAICWMLQGWFSPGWALYGGVLVVLRLGVFTYWMNSYWGGAVAATGGALVLGALPRLMRRVRVGTALILGLGLAILANSRPFEGFLLSLPVAGALLLWAFGKKHPPMWTLCRRLALPVLVVLAAHGRGHGLLQLARFRQSPDAALSDQPGHLRRRAVFPVAIAAARAGIPPSSHAGFLPLV